MRKWLKVGAGIALIYGAGLLTDSYVGPRRAEKIGNKANLYGSMRRFDAFREEAIRGDKINARSKDLIPFNTLF